MSKIDKDKLEYAIDYINQLAEGANADAIDEILNDPNTIRIMYFVRDILTKVRNGELTERHSNANRLNYPLEMLAAFSFQRDMSLTKFIEQCNTYVDQDKYKSLPRDPIIKWLVRNGYLQDVNGHKAPTQKGFDIGIYTKKFQLSGNREVEANVYNRGAQTFLIKNMQLIMSRNNEESVPYPEE